MACIPNMPAWVMPLHRLWDTVKAQAGLFDTVIIDEASQAGAEALLLLLLAKRVIVVGDDKQNSPEAVGIREDDIARLTRQHLGDYHFRDLFRPDVSLFDHSERAFGNIISLREHFRCVPEIIRFSNDLCYQSAPLIPLRQAPPNRLAPLKRVHVVGGACEGEGQRIINRAEAERIVETILSCVADSEYDGKTMGVIVLQGHSQAELIASMLAARLSPEAIERRKIRCGVPATFQGDQRDVIYLSLVASPDHRHRALGSLADTRRFNVAMSRARDQVWLFHSIKQHDLSPQCLRRQLLSYFENPHPAAQQRIIDWENLERQARTTRREMGSQPDPFDSWFEVDVALEIMRKGYAIRPQYEAAGKYIDPMIEGDDSRLAVECDGDFWHGPEKYAEDMARQRQLERVGQVFVRVRESQFYANRLVAIQEVIEECKRLGIEPLSAGGGTDETPAAEVRDGTIPEADNGGNGEEHDLEDDGDQESDDRTGPFAGYSEELNFPDPRDASIQNVSPALRQIIEKDGPLTRGSVLRLYIAGCPHLQRAGKTVQGALNRTLGAMIRSGEIVQEDELGDRNTRRHVVRLAGAPRVRQRPRGGRDLEEIPPSELALVVQTLNLAASHREADSGELHRPIMAHYGFNRLTASRRTYLEKVIVLARQAAGCNRLSGT